MEVNLGKKQAEQEELVHTREHELFDPGLWIFWVYPSLAERFELGDYGHALSGLNAASSILRRLVQLQEADVGGAHTLPVGGLEPDVEYTLGVGARHE